MYLSWVRAIDENGFLGHVPFFFSFRGRGSVAFGGPCIWLQRRGILATQTSGWVFGSSRCRDSQNQSHKAYHAKDIRCPRPEQKSRCGVAPQWDSGRWSTKG